MVAMAFMVLTMEGQVAVKKLDLSKVVLLIEIDMVILYQIITRKMAKTSQIVACPKKMKGLK